MIKQLSIVGALAFSFPATMTAQQCPCPPDEEWQKSWVSGDDDLHATEVRQFTVYGGSLYVAVGGWMDQQTPKGSAQILRLDSSDGKWVQEASLGGAGTTTGGLASLHLTQSKNGQPANAWVMVAATWSGANAYVRNEIDKKWYKTAFGDGQNRAFSAHKDEVAGYSFAFVGGKPGIFRGSLTDSYVAGKSPIEWNMKLELNTVNMNLPLCSGGGRITGFAEARGKLFASACWRVFVRTDGPIGKCSGPNEVQVGTDCKPRWEKFWDDPLAGQGESGLRGLTQVMYNGKQVLLIGSEQANAHITRLDPDSAESVVEFNVDNYLDNYFGYNSGYKIIPYNSPAPLWYGPDGIGRRILGFESWLPGKPTPDVSRKLVNESQLMMGEGMLFVRNSPGNFQLVHVPHITPQPMTAIRDCVASPFKDECNESGQDCVLYCGGFDANKSTTQTPCYTAPCTIPPLTSVPTHDTGFIVKGRITVPSGTAVESIVPDISQDDKEE
jgi:hypothetical protein